MTTEIITYLSATIVAAAIAGVGWFTKENGYEIGKDKRQHRWVED